MNKRDSEWGGYLAFFGFQLGFGGLGVPDKYRDFLPIILGVCVCCSRERPVRRGNIGEMKH